MSNAPGGLEEFHAEAQKLHRLMDDTDSQWMHVYDLVRGMRGILTSLELANGSTQASGMGSVALPGSDADRQSLEAGSQAFERHVWEEDRQVLEADRQALGADRQVQVLEADHQTQAGEAEPWWPACLPGCRPARSPAYFCLPADLLACAADAVPALHADHDCALAAVNRPAYPFFYTDDSSKADHQVDLADAANFGDALQHAEKGTEQSFVLSIVKVNSEHFKHASESMKNDSMYTPRITEAPSSCSECSTPGSPTDRSGSMRLTPEPSCNKKGLSSGTSSPTEPSAGEEEFLALWQTTVEAVGGITPSVLPAASALQADHVSGALPLAYGCEAAPSCTQNVHNGKEISSNSVLPGATEVDAAFATAASVVSISRGSLESSSEGATFAERSVSTSCASATCWQGLMISRGLVLGCTFAVVALVEVLFKVVKETLTGEEALEDTLARGSLRRVTLESIMEEEEERDEEGEGGEFAVLGE